MAKQVTHAIEFTDPIQPTLGPDRIIFLVMCDDGSIYEFQKMEDSPIWNLRARGSRSEPVRDWSARSAPLPRDVESTLNDRLGKKRWRK